MCPDSTSAERDGQFETTRRSMLRSAGVLGVGLHGVGFGRATSERNEDLQTEPRQLETSFDRMTWQSDHPTIRDRPIYELSFPGTHHAAMYDTSARDWWYTQTNDVYTQLNDGIRYLDVRVESQGNGSDTVFYGHHGGAGSYDDKGAKTGASLDYEVMPDIRAFLDDVAARGGKELVLLKLSHFWDSGTFSDDEFETDDWENLADLLRRELGPYALTPEWGMWSQRLSDFDGPKIAVFYKNGSDNRPSFVGDWTTWVDGGWLDEHRSGTVYTAALEHTHTSTSRLGETQMLVTPDFDAISTSWADSQYDNLWEAAVRTNQLLPGYTLAVKNDSSLNPNIVLVDYYETSDVVAHCRDLSVFGLHGTEANTPPIAEGTYRIQSVETGRVADVTNSSTANDANVQVWDWNGSGAQRFEFLANGDGTYRIVNENSGKVLEVSDSGGDNGDNIAQYDWNGTATQRWHVITLDDGEFALLNANSSRVFDASNPEAGSTIHQWHWHGQANQRWTLDSL